MSLLTLQNLSASYGSSQALFGVDLTMRAGEVTALMGRNGMGKSTTVKSICRMIASTGTLTLDGTDLHRLPSHKVARLGVGLVPEGRPASVIFSRVWVNARASAPRPCLAANSRCWRLAVL